MSSLLEEIVKEQAKKSLPEDFDEAVVIAEKNTAVAELLSKATLTAIILVLIEKGLITDDEMQQAMKESYSVIRAKLIGEDNGH